jgi:MFS family permease
MWLAKPIGLQIFSRVLQGIADAVIYIVGMAIMIDTVGTSRIAEYMGHVTIALNVGTFAGPLLGGAVFEAGGYHAVWGMMLGIVLVDTLLRLVMVEKLRPGIGDDREESTATAMTQNMSTTMGSVATTPRNGSTDRTGASSVVSRSKVPDIVLLLNSPRMVTACLGVCVQSMVFSGFETVLSIYVQDIWDFNALGAGLLFIPLTISAFFAPFIGRIVDRTSTRWALTVGFAAMLPVIVLVRFVDHNSIRQKVLMCAFLFIIGLGITVILGPLMAEISHIAEDFVKNGPFMVKSEEDRAQGAYAQAYALNAMAWSCGNVAGPLLCGFLKDHHGWGTMCWVLGLVSGLTAVPCFIWSGRPSAAQIWRSQGART